MGALPKPWMSVSEFTAWSATVPGRWQLVDGEPYAMAPRSDVHCSILGELTRLLGNHLLTSRRPCRVVPGGGVQPAFRSRLNARVPDIVVTCTPAQAGTPLVPEPVLIIEILSPSNAAQSWANVWTYTTIPSVADILVLQSESVGAELLRRRPDGAWPADGIEVGAELTLGSVGFSAPLDALYRTTPLA